MTSSSRSLVVGHDGSAGARQALDAAADLAEMLSAPLRVIRTWGIEPDPTIAELLLDDSRTREQIAETLTAALVRDCEEAAAAHPDLDITYAAIAGPAATVLCAESRDERMLVVGSRGFGGLRGLLLGSVSNRCLHLSTRPVLVVREKTDHPATPSHDPSYTPDVDAMDSPAEVAPGTIVVGYDGSPLHAPDPGEVGPSGGGAVAAAAEAIATQEEPGIAIRCRTINRSPAEGLVDAAMSASLLVIGRSQRNTNFPGSVGSVVHDVLLNLTGPTVVVHDTVPVRRSTFAQLRRAAQLT